MLHKNTFLELCEENKCRLLRTVIVSRRLWDTFAYTEWYGVYGALIENCQVQRYIGKRNITARREMGFLIPGSGYEYVTIVDTNVLWWWVMILLVCVTLTSRWRP